MNYYRDELYHHGIKGQKWGVRRWQNEDGTFNEAGKKRYFDAKNEYYDKKIDIKRRRAEINAKHDQRKNENMYGLDSGGLGQRMKNHIKNEYERSQAMNKLDQEALDAKRAYRESIGKKHVDTIFMKFDQKSINDIANQSITDFTKAYVKNALINAAQSAKSANQSYQRKKAEEDRRYEREKRERDRATADALNSMKTIYNYYDKGYTNYNKYL